MRLKSFRLAKALRLIVSKLFYELSLDQVELGGFLLSMIIPSSFSSTCRCLRCDADVGDSAGWLSIRCTDSHDTVERTSRRFFTSARDLSRIRARQCSLLSFTTDDS